MVDEVPLVAGDVRIGVGFVRGERRGVRSRQAVRAEPR
jgi:hypothetical protein